MTTRYAAQSRLVVVGDSVYDVKRYLQVAIPILLAVDNVMRSGEIQVALILI